MSYYKKHIIFTSCEVAEIADMTDSIVVPIKLPKDAASLLNPVGEFGDPVAALAYVLQETGYELSYAYEVFNPSAGYEVLVACHEKVDYIFSTSDAWFNSVMSEVIRWIASYYRQIAVLEELEAASEAAVDQFLIENNGELFPKNVALAALIKDVCSRNYEVIEEVVFGLLRRYQVYPIP